MRTLGFFILATAVVVTALVLGRVSSESPGSHNSRLPAATFEGGTFEASGETNGSPVESIGRRLSPRGTDPYIVIDRYCNRLYLRTADSVILDALCSTGSGGELVDSLTGRHWRFETPAGVFMVDSKLKNPWWRKPDWAFVEEGLPLPKDNSERLDDQMMGDYAIGFGDGYFIHGTIYERMLGVAVTHGCVRVGSHDLKKLYERIRVGTVVYVF